MRCLLSRTQCANRVLIGMTEALQVKSQWVSDTNAMCIASAEPSRIIDVMNAAIICFDATSQAVLSQCIALTSSAQITPTNIVNILLLVGADVVKVALAQLSCVSFPWPTPIVFSFGWVAYSLMALASVVGDRRIMPAPDVSSVVINAVSGYTVQNRSWILGRMLRDFEDGFWMDPSIKKQLEAKRKGDISWRRQMQFGLCISVYEADPRHDTGKPKRDYMLFLGYGVALCQIVIAAIPWIIWGTGNYMIFVVTVIGTLLAFIMGSLPQWRRDLLECRANTSNTYILTRSGYSLHALVIMGNHRGFRMDDLAGAGGEQRASTTTRWMIFCSTILWIMLLITFNGLNEHTWFLVAVGAVGSIYTIFVAAMPRHPENFGIHLQYTGKCLASEHAMIALMEAEQYHSGLGKALLRSYYPGTLGAKEDAFWRAAERLRQERYPMSGSHRVDTRADEGTTELKNKRKALGQGPRSTKEREKSDDI